MIRPLFIHKIIQVAKCIILLLSQFVAHSLCLLRDSRDDVENIQSLTCGVWDQISAAIGWSWKYRSLVDTGKMRTGSSPGNL